MYKQSQLENILFLDIETASVVPEYSELSERMQGLWDKKSRRYSSSDPEKKPAELFQEKAGIHAEFAKVVCISVGYLKFNDEGLPSMTMKSYSGPDEKQLLQDFGQMLNKYNAAKDNRKLCAHNGKEFDFPFLGRRYLINGLRLPVMLDIQGKKPWDIRWIIDTMELWKFGDFKSYTSLDLLTAVLGIPSPKDDIDGSQVGKVFWEEKDYERIKIYCEKDVRVTAQVLLRMSRFPLIPEELS